MEIYSITTLTKHWVLNFKVYGTCTGTKKVWLQSTPSLHRDKKSKSFELQSARNLHRDKKTKTLEGYLPQIDCKVFVFFGCFVPVQVWCTLKFNTFVFCPCAGLVHFEDLKFKTLIFCLSLYRFGTLWTSKLWFFCPCASSVHFEIQTPMHCYMCIVILYIFIVCRLLCFYLHFLNSHAVFWRVRCIIHAKGLQFEHKFDPFQSQILVSGNWIFVHVKCQYI